MFIPIFNEEAHSYCTQEGKPLIGVNNLLTAMGLHDYSRLDPWYAGRGKAVHKIVKLYHKDDLDEESIDPILRGYFDAYLKFLNDTGYKPQGVEQPLYHPQYFYAGTPDSWDASLYDIKTGGHEIVTVLKLGAYKELLQASGIHVRKAYAIHLTEDGKYSLREAENLRQAVSVFISVLNVYRWKENNLCKM